MEKRSRRGFFGLIAAAFMLLRRRRDWISPAQRKKLNIQVTIENSAAFNQAAAIRRFDEQWETLKAACYAPLFLPSDMTYVEFWRTRNHVLCSRPRENA